MRAKKFYEPLYEADVLFLTETTPNEIKEYLKKHKYSGEGEGFDTTMGSVSTMDMVDKDGRKIRNYMIIVEKKKDFYTLLHECLHLATHILNDRLVPITADNGEALAYYQTFWFKKLWRYVNNKEVVYRKRKI